jgi:CBS domain-containing protein
LNCFSTEFVALNKKERKDRIMDKPLASLTAADLMSRELVLVPQDMSLQGAARLLSRGHVSGAPVVDAKGRCVGVLSATDFLHWVENGHTKQMPSETVCQAWQILGDEPSPTDTVACLMTADPVVAVAGAGIGTLAQMMLDARIRRIVVVDHNERPIGIVSSTDVLAAVAREMKTKESSSAKDIAYQLPAHR